MKRLAILACLIALLIGGQALAADDSDVTAFVIVLDCSGSMKDPIVPGGNQNKWAVAQAEAIRLVRNIPAECEVAFIVYGTNAARKCDDVTVLRPLAPMKAADQAKLLAAVKALTYAGATPIALALQTADAELAKTNKFAKLILLTDGIETCGGNPVNEAKKLVAKHAHLVGGVDVIGFACNEKESAEAAKISEAGWGAYHEAKDAEGLKASVDRLIPLLRNEKPDPRGKPEGLKEGASRGWYVWHDDKGWHVRTTTKGHQHKFEGVIRVQEGRLKDPRPHELDGAARDWWKLSDDKQTLKLDLLTKGGKDGFNFKPDDEVKDIKFTLKIDNEPAPGKIYIGKMGLNPGQATFTLPAHPPKK
jgi:hypothetical protein